MAKRQDTRITHAGLRPKENFGIVNPPVYHASTILSPTLDAFQSRGSRRFEEGVYTYGRHGTPTHTAFEEAVAEIEGGYRAVAVGSGIAAINAAILAFVQGGDHVLMLDSAYGPARRFCDAFLKRFGVETTYYDPLIGAGIADLIQPNTKLVYLESPGSLTFEMQDVPAIAKAAHAAGAAVVMDNTWGVVFFDPFKHGVDVSVQAATKYIGGHSDIMLGTVTTTEEHWRAVRQAAADLGASAGPDDVYLALRGIRTIKVRLQRHQETGLTLARWLQDRPEVERVLHPALPGDAGYELWKRDFNGACGLFSFLLKDGYSREALAAMLDGLELYGMGASWGGFESLIIPANPAPIRTATRWDAPGQLLRVHAGLEDPDDLIADLEKGFERLNACQAKGAGS